MQFFKNTIIFLNKMICIVFKLSLFFFLYGVSFTVFRIFSTQHSTRFTVTSYSSQHRRPRRQNPALFRSASQRD